MAVEKKEQRKAEIVATIHSIMNRWTKLAYPADLIIKLRLNRRSSGSKKS